MNDYMLGQKHNLESIDIFNDDATIAPAAGMYVGMDRFECREQIAKDLQEAGLIEKIENYENKVGYSERNSDTVTEPRLSDTMVSQDGIACQTRTRFRGERHC